MKRYVNKLIRLIVRIDIFWKLIRPVVDFFKNMEHQRRVVEAQPSDNFIKNKVLQQPVVRNGLFKGLKYPVFEAAGSAVYPKFIGSYEKELEFIFKKIIKEKYDTILDIGCAEGYYANGLAYVLPDAKVYAFDVDERARMICTQIAQMNQLQERVKIGSYMDSNGLATFQFPKSKSLVISDCEGFEKKLFTKENVQHLRSTDILIEVHDLFDLNISAYLKDVFAETHSIQIISSVDDVKKAQTYEYPETASLDINMRKRIFAEGRQAAMEWFYCTPN